MVFSHLVLDNVDEVNNSILFLRIGQIKDVILNQRFVNNICVAKLARFPRTIILPGFLKRTSLKHKNRNQNLMSAVGCVVRLDLQRKSETKMIKC